MNLHWGALHDPAFLVITAIVLTAVSGIPCYFSHDTQVLDSLSPPAAPFSEVCSAWAAALPFCSEPAGPPLSRSPWVPVRSLRYLHRSPLVSVPSADLPGGRLCGYLCRQLLGGCNNRRTEPLLTFSLGLLAAAMALVVIAGNGALFLMAWEVMALTAGLALTVEHERREVREAGSIYLIATHTGTVALFVMFALLRATTGSFIVPAGGSLAAATLPGTAIFLCALVGFGSKAGLMPFHIWLPAAHANAPSHISALMSGVMLKMGLYGIIRVVSLYGQPLWWGMILLGCGLVSALLGIVFAIAQNDLKRLLAYSSIENIGIIAMGVGVGLIGMLTDRPLLGLLGLAGGLLHILNHSLFKPLLFPLRRSSDPCDRNAGDRSDGGLADGCRGRRLLPRRCRRNLRSSRL